MWADFQSWANLVASVRSSLSRFMGESALIGVNATSLGECA
jgi:hypothetical protein